MSRPMLRAASTLALATALVAAPAAGQTLYKLVDRNGKVTYADSPPKDFDGKVTRIDVDPKANTATLPRAPAEGFGDRGPARSAEDPVRAAREKLDAARKALADARDNPGEGDITRVGKKGGGTRPEPSEDYRQRLERLEKNVREAEEELAKAQRGR